MRTRPKNERGYLTLTALCLTTIVGISLASYISLSYQSYLFSFRLFQLAQCRQLAETGLEEALWSLNTGNNPSNSVAATAWSNAAWTVSSPPSGPTQTCTITGYQLGEGVTGQVTVTITNYNWSFATALAPPLQPPSVSATATVTLPTGGQLTKTLSAGLKPATLFPNAVGVTNVSGGSIYFFGGGLGDSWHSNPSGDYTTFIPYSAVTHPPNAGAAPNTYGATLAAAGTGTAMSLGNAQIYGYLATFGAPISLSSYSVQGPTSGSSIDSSRIYRSAFVPSFPVAAPIGAAYGYLNGTNQTIGDTSANPSTQIYDLSAGSNLVVHGYSITIQGPVIIRVPGNLDMYSAGTIQISNTPTSRLEIFVGGSVGGDVSIGHQIGSIAGFANLTHLPKNLALYSLCPLSSRQFHYWTSLDFCGVIYSAASRSQMFFKSSPSLSGALLANFDVIFDSGTTPQIHYDQALQNLPKGWFKGINTPFILQQITES